jgi:formiminoglutamase
MTLFEITQRPDCRFFRGGHDPKDPRLEGQVCWQPKDYIASQYVILGCPEDEGVKRNQGRPGARKSPEEIRQAFYRLAATEVIQSLDIFDLGDVILGHSLEETHHRLRDVVRQILEDDKMAIILGGGNDISYPDCDALADEKKDLLVFNIDKHFDVRELYPRNSGTAYRQLLEEGLIEPGKFYEMGSEEFANSPLYKEYLTDKGVHIYTLDDLRGQGIEAVFQNIIQETEHEAIFWGFDLDVVRDADAPGVSAGYPTGLTAKEIIKIAEIAGRETASGVLEFTEVNPDVDIDNRTSKLTAILIHTFLSATLS